MAEHYQAGQLQNPFTILRKVSTADGAGGFTDVEAQVGSAHLAFIRAVRGSERVLNDGLAAVGEVLFVMWAAIDVRTTDVLLYNGLRYNVRSLPPAGLSKFREVLTESGAVS